MPTSLDRTTAAPFLSASPAAMAAEGPALERLAAEREEHLISAAQMKARKTVLAAKVAMQAVARSQKQ